MTLPPLKDSVLDQTQALLSLLLDEASTLAYKGCRLHNPNYMTFQKRQNYADSKKTSGCQGFGGKEEG